MLHQETWVRFGTNGIGLSDHQNRFSNGVRIANWVENEFGDHLTKVALQNIAFASFVLTFGNISLWQTVSDRTLPFPSSTAQSDFRGTPLDDEGAKPCLAGTRTSASLVGPPNS